MKKIGIFCLAAALAMPSLSWSAQAGTAGAGFSLAAVAEAAQTAPTNAPAMKKLAVGEVTVYDFGKIKLHAYKTNDTLGDECYLLENKKNVVLLESAAFKDVVQEWSAYAKSLNKPVAGALLAYHPNGYEEYGNVNVYATKNALQNWQEGGSIRGLTDNFVKIFGNKIDANLPSAIKQVAEGTTVEMGGMKFNILASGDAAYSIEIPEINVVYRHMMGSKSHNILVSKEHIAAEIAAMEQYQDKKYALVLTSHYMPEGQAAVVEKSAYLEEVKALAEQCKSKDEFTAVVKAAFPGYGGEIYLDMTAGFLYK